MMKSQKKEKIELSVNSEKIDKPVQNAEYSVLLPSMNEGFHLGYQQKSGIVSGHSNHPREWLQSFARNMSTNGNDVGYSIPDVLAWEEQLCRIMRLPAEESAMNGQIIEYRAILSLLLLWDFWEQDERWPLLEMVCLSGNNTAFQTVVTESLSKSRVDDGLWIFTIRKRESDESTRRPIALLSRKTAIVPAANIAGAIALFPKRVRWVNTEKKALLDPCALLTVSEASIVKYRLRQLCRLCEDSALESFLYDSDATLTRSLRAFEKEIQQAETKRLEAYYASDEQSYRIFRTCFASVYGFPKELKISQILLNPQDCRMEHNFLLALFLGKEEPVLPAEAPTLFLAGNRLFAFAGQDTIPFSANEFNEARLIDILSEQVELLLQKSGLFRQKILNALNMACHNTDDARKQALLIRFEQQIRRMIQPAALELEISCPLKKVSVAEHFLLSEALQLPDSGLLTEPTSDFLALASASPCPGSGLDEFFRVEGFSEECYALLPISPEFCALLQQSDCCEPDYRHCHFRLDEAEKQICAKIVIRSKTADGRHSSVCLTRNYPLADQIAMDCATTLSEIPRLMLWPGIHLSPSLWSRYYLFSCDDSYCSARLFNGNEWVRGETHRRGNQCWSLSVSPLFPKFVLLWHGQVSLGAIPNLLPVTQVHLSPPAVAAVDFGSSTTAVMLQIEKTVFPAALPEHLHYPLFGGSCESELLRDVFLPEKQDFSSFFSILDLFPDQPEHWNSPLQNGHICHFDSFHELYRKNSDELYCDFSWKEDNCSANCSELFLRQVMLQTLLCARLNGASSLSWRFTLPDALSADCRQKYTALIRSLTRSLAEETNVPLTQDVPETVFISTSSAVGRYFRCSEESRAGSNFLCLEVGASSVGISLWNAGNHGNGLSCSVPLGTHAALYKHLLDTHLSDLLREATPDLIPLFKQLSDIACSDSSFRQNRGKSLLMLDMLLAGIPEQLSDMMNQEKSNGSISCLEALLLFCFGYLFYLCGEMLNLACRNEEVKASLSETIPLCIAGNGSKLLDLLSEDDLIKLCSLCFNRLSPEHPLRGLLPMLSAHPKQEALRGLLLDAEDTQQTKTSSKNDSSEFIANFIGDYFSAFRSAFPKAAQKLLPSIYSEDSCLCKTARLELNHVCQSNDHFTTADFFESAARCFSTIAGMWKV